jgi:DNA-binding NtrC family response regulator
LFVPPNKSIVQRDELGRPVPLRSNTTAKQHRGSMELNYCAIELRSLLRYSERDYLQKMLDRHEGNVTHAAQAAAKNRRAFWELLQKHGFSLERNRFAVGKEPTRTG